MKNMTNALAALIDRLPARWRRPIYGALGIAALMPYFVSMPDWWTSEVVDLMQALGFGLAAYKTIDPANKES